MDVLVVATPVGPFTLLARRGEVYAAGFTDDVQRLASSIAASLRGADDEPLRPVAHLAGISEPVAAYLAGDLAAIDRVPLRWESTDFYDRAWRAMRAVPAGQAISYGELARRCGADGWEAARAAGQACARNPNSLFVP